MVGAAEMITNRHKCSGRFGCYRHFNGLARGNFFVQLERTQEKAVRDVLAVDTQLDRFAFLERDPVGAEGEALRRDFHDGRIGRSRARVSGLSAGEGCERGKAQYRYKESCHIASKHNSSFFS